jgi:hypothetical protein
LDKRRERRHKEDVDISIFSLLACKVFLNFILLHFIDPEFYVYVAQLRKGCGGRCADK